MENSLRNALILSLLGFLCLGSSQCGPDVIIKNYEFCGDLGPLGASCFNTQKQDSRRIDKEAWDKERFGMLCHTAEVFADNKAAVEELCHQTKNCSYEHIEEQIKRLDEQIKRLQLLKLTLQ